MPLIKGITATELAKGAVVLDLGDLQRQAELLHRQARERAEAVVDQARHERARILAGAAEQGRAEGYARGLEEGRRTGVEQALTTAVAEHQLKLEAIEANWSGALAEFSAQRDALIQSATRDVITLGVMIAERVIKRVIEHDPAVVQDQLTAALGVIVRPTEVAIVIHPDDRPMTQRCLPGLLAAMSAIRHAEIVEDKSVTRGGCIVRTRGDGSAGDPGGGEVDARIATQVDRIVAALLPGPASGDVPEDARLV